MRPRKGLLPAGQKAAAALARLRNETLGDWCRFVRLPSSARRTTAPSSQELLAQFLRPGDGATEREHDALVEDEFPRGHKQAPCALPVWMIDEPSPFSSTSELEVFLASLADLPNDPEVLQARRYANDLLERHRQIAARRRN